LTAPARRTWARKLRYAPVPAMIPSAPFIGTAPVVCVMGVGAAVVAGCTVVLPFRPPPGRIAEELNTEREGQASLYARPSPAAPLQPRPLPTSGDVR
jgi:hypothetical protein